MSLQKLDGEQEKPFEKDEEAEGDGAEETESGDPGDAEGEMFQPVEEKPEQ